MLHELRIGLVGTGRIGQEHLKRINTKLQGGSVVACADVNPEFAASIAKKNSLKRFESGEALIASTEVDAILVCTADEHHERFVMASLDAGKHVFCEKPLAVDPAACLRLVQAEMNFGARLIQIGFMRRYDAGYRQLHQIIREKRYGEPLLAHCAHRNYIAVPGYCTNMVVDNTVVHEIDVMRYVLGEDFRDAEVVFPKRTRFSAEDHWDPQIVILTTVSGIRVDVELFINSYSAYEIKCEICCEKGIVELPEPPSVRVHSDGLETRELCKDWVSRFEDAYTAELQNWIMCTREGYTGGPSAWEAYCTSLTTSAATLARDTGCRTKIPAYEMPEFYKTPPK